MKKQLNVLVVDDEPDIREIISYNLKKENHQVRTAENGLKGIELLEDFLPDLIIMDIRMPEMNGIQMCTEIRKKEIYRNIPVLFLTADTDEFTSLTAMEAGGNHLVTKPVKPGVLMSIIDELIQEL